VALHSKWLEGHFESICNNHVSQASVGRAALLETSIPLPPFPEQLRIVAKIEALLLRVNNARGKFAKLPAMLKRFRQSVLAAGCSGRLTADWRDEHSDPEPEPTALLHSDSRVRKRSRPQSESSDEIRELPELPERWSFVQLAAAARLIQYGTSERATEFGKGIAVLRMSNVQDGGYCPN
jgi:type I restriction enzyme, S subunit